MRLMFVVFFLVGCGGAPQAVRKTIDVTARGVAAIDEQLGPRYADRAESCRQASDSWGEYDGCIAHWNTAADANEAAREGLLAMEAAADSWDAGSEQDWAGLAACTVEVLQQLTVSAGAAGIPLPEAIGSAIALASDFGGTCEHP